MSILLSSHVTVLCRAADGALCLRPFAEAGADAVDPASVETAPDGEGRLVTVAEDGRFLRTEAAGRVLRLDGPGAATRELFLPMGAADRAALAALSEGRWIRRPAATSARRVRACAPADAAPVTLRPPFQLAWNGLVFDLAAQLPLTGRLPLRVSLFRGNAGLVELCRYRPLVVVTAFREDAGAGMLHAALRALAGAGGYGDDVLVLTDLGASEVEHALSAIHPSRQAVVRLAPRDRTGRLAARMALSFIERCRLHQPLLCLEAARLVTAPVEPLLLGMATADAMRLCEAEDAAAPGWGQAVLALPNLALVEDTLRMWRQMMAGAADLSGRVDGGAAFGTMPDLAGIGRAFFGGAAPREEACGHG